MPPKPPGPSAGKSGKENVKLAGVKRFRFFQEQNEYSEVKNTPTAWNAICLPLIGTLLLAFAIALIIVGIVKDIDDLIILGSLFVAGSFIFFVLLYINVCRPLCARNQIESFDYIDRVEATKEKFVQPVEHPPPNYSYANPEFDSKEDLTLALSRSGPPESLLYGAHKMRSFMATPATTSGVHFDDGAETPPPPRLALPSDYADNNNL